MIIEVSEKTVTANHICLGDVLIMNAVEDNSIWYEIKKNKEIYRYSYVWIMNMKRYGWV